MKTFLTPEEMAEYSRRWIVERLTEDEMLNARLSRKRFLILLKQLRSIANVQMSLCLFLELFRVEQNFVRQTRILNELERKIGQAGQSDVEMLEYLQVVVSESSIMTDADIRIVVMMLSKMSLRLRLESKKEDPERLGQYADRHRYFSEFLRKSGFGFRLNPPIRNFDSVA